MSTPELREAGTALERGDYALSARVLEAARADGFLRRDRESLEAVLEAATKLEQSAQSADRKVRREAGRLVANTRYSLQNLVTPSGGQWYPAEAAPAQAAPSPAGLDPIDQIRRLAELRDAGVLAEEEFQTKKAELLARL